jgi:hypothetical protein
MIKRRIMRSAIQQRVCKTPRSAPPTFTLRNFMLFGVGIALLCGLRWFVVAIFISVYALIYYVCLGLGWSLTRRRDQPIASPIPLLEIRDKSTIPALVTVILCNLSVYFTWHVLIIMSGRSGAIHYFFYAPVIGGLSLYVLQQLTLVLLHVALLLTFFGNCWQATRVDPAECRTTAAYSFLLTIGHLAQPWAVDRLLALSFWLSPQVPLPTN